MFETPILLIIFKRKDTALKVLEVIKKIKPKYLYIAVDGWRDENEKIKCLEINSLKIILNLFQSLFYQHFQPT